jgi:hypothetical protein
MTRNTFRVLSFFMATAALSLPCRADDKTASALPALPREARLAFQEDWASNRIDPARWYALHKKWGQGNNGVTRENVSIGRDLVDGKEQNVLVCVAQGDQYEGPVTGAGGQKTRVGGVLATKSFFASGRYEVRMKIGKAQPLVEAPGDAGQPKGAVPAIWTYAYRWVQVPEEKKPDFVPEPPMYNPLMGVSGSPATEYWSEIDFPELGKNGDFAHGLFNTFIQKRYNWQTFSVPSVTDGQYHTYTMEWRTELKPLADVKDSQVVEHDGFWWVQDKTIPINSYLSNPLRRLGKDQYAVCWGKKAEYWIDNQRVGATMSNVPSMAAQLTIGVWLPQWGGPAPWQKATVSFSSVKIWQYDDAGDVRGVLTQDVPANI